MAINHFQYTIVGAGASGLWLALALMDEGLLADRSLCIVEPETSKGNDRTWCYWDQKGICHGSLNQHVWSRFMHPARPEEQVAIAPYRYFHLRSTDFYEYAHAKLSTCSNVYWRHEALENLSELQDKIALTGSSSTWTSDHVFVSAMPAEGTPLGSTLSAFMQMKQRPVEYMLWQSFVGWRVRSAQPIFRKEAVTLMNFDVAQQGSTQFIYELPFTEHEALVELTRFALAKLSKEEALPLLEKHLAGYEGQYTIEEWEIGAIPMTNMLDIKRKALAPDTKVIFIGTPAGAVKPTTGYAFKRMEAYARSLARALKNNTALPTMRRKWRFRLYDILLLQILQDEAHRGRAVFMQLFKSQPMKRILKFLDEETHLAEELLIFMRLPKRLFISSLIKYIRRT